MNVHARPATAEQIAEIIGPLDDAVVGGLASDF